MDDRQPDEDASRIASDPCTCGHRTSPRSASETPRSDRWIGGSSPLDEALPRDVQTALGRLLDEGPIERLDEWIASVRERTGGGAIGIDDLCRVSGTSDHWAEVGGDRYHFRCFYDAVILSALIDEPVAIRTESPDGTAIQGVAAGPDELQVSPREAVFSFGVDESVDRPANGAPTKSTVYAVVCPYVRAFPNRDAYEQWAGAVPAATVAMPLAGATDLAAALVE